MRRLSKLAVQQIITRPIRQSCNPAAACGGHRINVNRQGERDRGGRGRYKVMAFFRRDVI
ncbi:MAG: hypothetical protein V7632_1496 [Bradyrhizobium sp.]|jgi:hypothetical protein